MYEAVLGDTWDLISYKVYGSEIHADYLMDNNPFLIGVGIFNAGQIVYTPELPAETDGDFPDWR